MPRTWMEELWVREYHDRRMEQQMRIVNQLESAGVVDEKEAIDMMQQISENIRSVSQATGMTAAEAAVNIERAAQAGLSVSHIFISEKEAIEASAEVDLFVRNQMSGIPAAVITGSPIDHMKVISEAMQKIKRERGCKHEIGESGTLERIGFDLFICVKCGKEERAAAAGYE